MKVRFFPTIELIDRDAIQGSIAVVIDVLRSSSTIISALENGARSVIPVADIETASRIVKDEDRPIKLLAGERKGDRIAGFDLGNSPLEFTKEKVSGKIIVMSTSNGTRALATIPRARKVYVCALINLSSVIERIRDEGEVSIVCCGDEGNLSAEDLLCGGMILERLSSWIEEDSLNDSAMIAKILAREEGDRIEEFLLRTDRGRVLKEKGFVEDIAYCSKIDRSPIVPVLSDGSVVRIEE